MKSVYPAQGRRESSTASPHKAHALLSNRTREDRRILTALAALGLVASASAQQPSFRRIAVHGDQAPGTPAGVTFFDTFMETNFPSSPGIDDDGNVSFHAVLTGPGITPTISGNALAIYKHRGGTLSLIARQREQAPGAPAGVLFVGFASGLGPVAPVLAGGHATFFGGLQGPGVVSGNSSGVWSDRSGAVQLLYRAGDPFPLGAPGATLQGISGYHLRRDPTGLLTFEAAWSLSGAPGDPDELEGVFTERSGAAQAIVRGREPAPGVPGAVFGRGGMFTLSGAFRGWDADAAHRIAIHGNLRGPAIHDLNDEGIWVEGAAGLGLLIREGDPAPGLGPSAHIGIISGIDAFGSRWPVDVNDSGQLLFMARTDLDDFVEAAYVRREQTIELVAQARDASNSVPGPQAPGLAPGLYFHALLWANLNNAGRVAMVNSFTNQGLTVSGRGIWSDQHGPLALVAATGMQAHGLPPGAVYGGDFQIGSTYGDHTILFVVTVSGPGFPQRRVTYLTDAAAVPHPVLMPGQQVNTAPPGAPTRWRIISDILHGGMSNAGEVVFKALFTDNTIAVMTVSLGPACYANCDNSTMPPVLNVNDFTCFLNRYAAADPYANCDASTFPPILNVNDFTCFLNRYAAGCP